MTFEFRKMNKKFEKLRERDEITKLGFRSIGDPLLSCPSLSKKSKNEKTIHVRTKVSGDKAIYFLTRALNQSIFGLLNSKPNVKWFFASYTFSFVKTYLVGLNTLRTPIIRGARIGQKLMGYV